jgi:hypothetical protein
MPVLGAVASALPSALSALPTAAAVSLPCVTVVVEIVEIVAMPAVLLPGGTMTLLAGALWFTAAMPSLAGAAGMRYRLFALRVVITRVPWLAAALSVAALAARSRGSGTSPGSPD